MNKSQKLLQRLKSIKGCLNRWIKFQDSQINNYTVTTVKTFNSANLNVSFFIRQSPSRVKCLVKKWINLLQLVPSAWILDSLNSIHLSELLLFRQTIKHHICPENWAVIQGSLSNLILFHYAALVARKTISPFTRMLMLYLPPRLCSVV